MNFSLQSLVENNIIKSASAIVIGILALFLGFIPAGIIFMLYAVIVLCKPRDDNEEITIEENQEEVLE